MRLLYTIVFFLLTSIVFGQKSTLLQNVNVRAKELKHNLNDTGDKLVFQCERTIYEVVIFNDDFERVIKVRDAEAKIPISDIPVGRYIVEALLSDKLIVITLLRNEPFDLGSAESLVTDSSDLFGKKAKPQKEVIASVEKPIEKPKAEMEQKVAAVTKKVTVPVKESFGSESNIKKTDLAVAGKKAQPKPELPKEVKRVVAKKVITKKVFVEKKKATKKSSLSLFNSDIDSEAKVVRKISKRSSSLDNDVARTNRIESTYWIIYQINNGHSSRKILKMGDQETVDRMIRKIETDMKTRAGRLNELTVWTVYDPSKFVQHKKKNKEEYMNIASESFNIEPYYKKQNSPDNI